MCSDILEGIDKQLYCPSSNLWFFCHLLTTSTSGGGTLRSSKTIFAEIFLVQTCSKNLKGGYIPVAPMVPLPIILSTCIKWIKKWSLFV